MIALSIVILAHVVYITSALVAFVAPFFILKYKSVLWLFWWVVCSELLRSELINNLIMNYWGLSK